MIVTLFAWIAHRLQSSKRWTRKSSVASCIARRLSAVYLKGSGETSLEISRTCWIARLVRAEVTWQGGVPGKKRTYQATERSFPDEKVCAFLKFSNFFQCKSPWFVSSPPFLFRSRCNNVNVRYKITSEVFRGLQSAHGNSERIPRRRTWCMIIAGVSVVCGFFPGFFTLWCELRQAKKTRETSGLERTLRDCLPCSFRAI